MRVLKVVQSYFPFREQGGPVVKVRALAHGLAQRGHEITVLTADLGLKKAVGAPMSFRSCRWGYCAEENGVHAVYLSTVARYRALTLNPGVIGFCRASLRHFDLVHFYGLYDLLGPSVSHFCRKQGVPYVIEPMGMFRPIDRSFRLKRTWHRNLGANFWTGSSQIVATSEMEQQELLADGVPTEKVVVRYNGIEGQAFSFVNARGNFRKRWGIGPAEPILLFLGRLIPRKGADILIDAFAKACPDSGRLVIAGPEGEPGYQRLLSKRAREAGVELRVIFPGALYDDDKSAVLADSDIFVLPSKYENFANSVAEAMACGIPVIITDACGIRSLVEGRAGLVISPEQEALTEAIATLSSDRTMYQKFQKGSRAAAAELGWERLSDQMEGYYSKVLGSRNGGH